MLHTLHRPFDHNECCIVIYMFMQKYTYICWIHSDAMNNRRNNKDAGRIFFTNISTSHFIARVRKGYSRFACERVLETEQKLQYFDLHSYGRQRCVFLVLLMLNWSPGVHSAGCWLSLLHLISIFSGPQLIRATKPLRPGVALPTTSHLQRCWNCLLQLSVDCSTATVSGTRTQLALDFCLDCVI